MSLNGKTIDSAVSRMTHGNHNNYQIYSDIITPWIEKCGGNSKAPRKLSALAPRVCICKVSFEVTILTVMMALENVLDDRLHVPPTHLLPRLLAIWLCVFWAARCILLEHDFAGPSGKITLRASPSVHLNANARPKHCIYKRLEVRSSVIIPSSVVTR
jgi:hypothetical protein